MLKSDKFDLSYDQYTKLTNVKLKDKPEKSLDKINFAKIVIRQTTDWEHLDINIKIDALVSHIKSSNHLE